MRNFRYFRPQQTIIETVFFAIWMSQVTPSRSPPQPLPQPSLVGAWHRTDRFHSKILQSRQSFLSNLDVLCYLLSIVHSYLILRKMQTPTSTSTIQYWWPLKIPGNHFSTRTWPPPQQWLRPESPGVVPRSSTCAPLLRPRRVVPNPVPNDAGASGQNTLLHRQPLCNAVTYSTKMKVFIYYLIIYMKMASACLSLSPLLSFRLLPDGWDFRHGRCEQWHGLHDNLFYLSRTLSRTMPRFH